MKKSKNIYSYKLAIPTIVIFTAMFIVPVIMGVFAAFADWNIRNLYELKFNGLENFVKIFKDKYFLLAIKNTFLFTIVTTIVKVIFAVLLALALVKPLKTQKFMRSIFYVPSILSGVAIF